MNPSGLLSCGLWLWCVFTAAAASANDEDDDAEQLRASIAGLSFYHNT